MEEHSLNVMRDFFVEMEISVYKQSEHISREMLWICTKQNERVANMIV